ncbi:MAG: hypothetical protein ABIH01_02385 [Candidatus Omnitrophota bacterium]
MVILKKAEKKYIKNSIAAFLIWAIGLSNICWAMDCPVKNRDLLSPAIHIQSGIFQDVYVQLTSHLEKEKEIFTPPQAIRLLIAKNPALQSNSAIVGILDIFEEAFLLCEDAQGYKAFLEAVPQMNVHALKDKDVQQLFPQALASWEKALKLLDNIDIEALKREIPPQLNEILFHILFVRADTHYQLGFSQQSSEKKQKETAAHFERARENISRALALSGVQPDFQSFALAGIINSKLSVTQKSLDEKIDVAEQAINYYIKAEELKDTLPPTKEAKIQTDEMYYNYFSTLYYRGDLYGEAKNLSAKLTDYENAEKLLVQFLSNPQYLAGIQGFHLDFYRLLWAYSDEFARVADKEDVEITKEAAKKLYAKTRQVARDYYELLSGALKKQEAGLDAMFCVADISNKLSERFLAEGRINEARDELKQSVQPLKEVHNFVSRNPFNNFSAGKLSYSFLWDSFLLLRELIQTGRITNSDFPLSEYLAEEYFKEFLEKFKSGSYDGLVKAISAGGADTKEEEILQRELYHNSTLIQPLIARFEKAVLAKNASKEFLRQFGNLTYLVLAAAYVMEKDYEKARYNILQSLNRYPDKFTKSISFESAILPQLAAYPETGKDFLVQLLTAGMHRRRVISYIADRKENFPEYIIVFLKEVVTGQICADTKKAAISELEPLTRALEIEIDGVKDKDAQAVSGPEKLGLKRPVKIVKPEKTSDTSLIAAVEDTVQKLETLQAPVKKKGKKQPKKTAKLKPDAPPLKKFHNALTALTQEFTVSEDKEIFVYLQALACRPDFLKQALCVRNIAQVFAQMETEAGLSLLSALRDNKVSPVVTSMFKEIDELHQGLSEYFLRLKSFEMECIALEQQLKSIDIISLARGEAHIKLAGFQRDYRFLMGRYADLGSRERGKIKHKAWTNKFDRAFLLMATDIKNVHEAKVKQFIESINTASNKLDEEWEDIMSGSVSVSKADIVLALEQWRKTQTFSRPCADIRADEKVVQAQKQLEQKWNQMQDRIAAAIEENSLICNGMVRFIITGEAETVYFKGVKFPNQELDKLFLKEGREVIEAIMRYNADIDIESAVSAEEYDVVEGWLSPLLEKIKYIIKNNARVLKQSRLTQAFDDVDALYEQLASGVESIKARDLPPLQLLKAINNFLPDEIDYPESVTELAYSPAELALLKGKIKDFDKKIEALYKEEEEMSIVCKGAFGVSVGGNFKSLHFEPLIKDPLKRDIENEARELIAEALSCNINLQVTVPQGVKQSLPWMKLIANLWQQEREAAKINLAQKKLIDTQAAKKTGVSRDNVELIGRAI